MSHPARGKAIRIFLTALFLPILLMLPAGRGSDLPRPSAREERIARAERREHVRLALRSADAHGYYVFDELMTETAGMIDYLAVGPVGGCVVVVRDEAGKVTADVDGTLYLDGRRFVDDPRRQAEDLAADVNLKFVDTGAYAYNVICFTRAELYYLGEDESVLKGVCPTWDLPLSFAEAPEAHTPADVAELADRVREVYGRPPFVVPDKDDS